MIRPAKLADVPALVALEAQCFDDDALSRRSFRHMLTRGRADLVVEAAHGGLRGYVLVIYRENSRLARMYSLAVAPEARGSGVARALVRAAERAARDRSCDTMRLELRADNAPARKLYASLGYRPFERVPAYYADGMEAVRMEKRLED